VDPFPVHFKRRTCQLVPRAISRDGAPRAFLKVSIDRRYGGNVSYLSGFKDRIAAIHWPLIEQFCDHEEIQLETITWAQLDQEAHLPRHIDFLSIDTEGSDLEILESIDFSCHTFGAIIFEHNYNQDLRRQAGALLTMHNYRLYKALEIDDLYVRRGLS
jgi:hypothetical protein